MISCSSLPSRGSNASSRRRRLQRLDRIKFDQLREYYRSGSAGETEVGSDYLRDIIRFESLFLVEGDPVPDWQTARLSSCLELISDDDLGLRPPAA